jgi:hypothetical protein
MSRKIKIIRGDFEMKTERILYLTLKKKWFDKIKNEEKKVEYREIKPYWIKRLTYGLIAFYSPKEFDFIIFSNGYSKDSPKLKVECPNKNRDMETEIFEGKDCFAIKLGKVKVLK